MAPFQDTPGQVTVLKTNEMEKKDHTDLVGLKRVFRWDLKVGRFYFPGGLWVSSRDEELHGSKPGLFGG